MRKNIIPIQEIKRNNRVKELMANKVQQKNSKPERLTQDEMYEVKAFMREGKSRNEAVELILLKRKLLNSKDVKKDLISNYNTGGFIDDNKYKQPVKHRLFK